VRYAASLAEQPLRKYHKGGGQRAAAAESGGGRTHHAEHHDASALKQSVRALAVSSGASNPRAMNGGRARGERARGDHRVKAAMGRLACGCGGHCAEQRERRCKQKRAHGQSDLMPVERFEVGKTR
jgi:hypothetical protein